MSSFSTQQKPSRTYEQYRCIVCENELSSKGVCKRHLEEQHITPKVYECEGCHSYFDTKPEAKKHCSQCCGDGELAWISTTLPKKVYACEYTGSYFLSKERYAQHLLVLSEQRGPRPRANLHTKLDAILRYAGKHNEALMPLCGQISQSLFDSPDAWKDLRWDRDYLQAKITVLEHATFHENGTVESTRWSGSAPKRRDTESYLTQLFQAGRLPNHKGDLAHIKPEAMPMCSTPMPVAYTAPSVASGPSSADTPLRATSPTSRSQSRQTAWSHDCTDLPTSASTPRSGDEIMTAELKSKRHLSDESRSYIPARTPPGPPEPLEQYQYPSDPSLMGQAPQLPPLPAFMTPSNSTISLPLRKQEGGGMPPPDQIMVSGGPHYHPMYQLPPANSSHTLTSDAASETSTLAQSYREPEFLDPHSAMPIDYNLWSQQQLAFQQQQQHMGVYPYGGGFDYNMPDDASIVASSINTGNTIVDYVTEIPKMEGYSDMDLTGPGHGHGTFFLDGGEDEGRGEEMR